MEQPPTPTPSAPSMSGTPSNTDGNNYAPFGKRVLALLIDSVILTAIYFAFTLPIFFVDDSGYLPLLFTSIANLVMFAFSVWNFVYLMKKQGSTVGKKAMNIKVTRTDGSGLSWGRILFRELIGKWVSSVILYIGFIMAAFTPKKQGLHDMISDTIVVDA